MRPITGFSSETMQTKRWWNIFKAPEEMHCQPRILYPVRIPSKMKAK